MTKLHQNRTNRGTLITNVNSRNLPLLKKSSRQLSQTMKRNTMSKKVSIFVTNNSTTTNKMKTKSKTICFRISLSLKNLKSPSKNPNKTSLLLSINLSFLTGRNIIWEKKPRISTCCGQREKKNLRSYALPSPWSIADHNNYSSIIDPYTLAIKMLSTKRRRELKLKWLKNWLNKQSNRNWNCSTSKNINRRSSES